MLRIIFAATLSYLVGSIPSAYMLGKIFKGLDIREYGSRNVGATNAFRVLGKNFGIVVLIADALKGLICVSLFANIFGITSLIVRVVLGIFAVVGHIFSCFLKFKGGKGVATSLGVLIGLALSIEGMSGILGLCVMLWLLVFLLSKIVSLASITTAIFLPFFMIFFNQPREIILMGLIFSLAIVLRHKENIKRLIKGEELRVKLFK